MSGSDILRRSAWMREGRSDVVHGFLDAAMGQDEEPRGNECVEMQHMAYSKAGMDESVRDCYLFSSASSCLPRYCGNSESVCQTDRNST